MEKELWLSRDDTYIGHYNICTEENIAEGVSSRGMWYSFRACFEPEDFHKLFPGQSLRKGRKRKIKRILIELED